MDLMIEDRMEQLVQGGGSDLHIAQVSPPLWPLQRRIAADDGAPTG